MGYAKLNIWIRHADCSLVTTCWMTDLVIKTCGGDYLVDMDPSVIGRLKEQYPDMGVEVLPNYHGETRIRIRPPAGRYINHIEAPVPPGCYVVWTRVCHGDNEETNKVMVIACCDDHICVNLLLNTVQTCVGQVLHPVLVRGVQLGLPRAQLRAAADVLLAVGEKPAHEMMAELRHRAAELDAKNEPATLNAIKEIMALMKEKPAAAKDQA